MIMNNKRKILIAIMCIIVMIISQTALLIKTVNAETITGSEGNISWSFDTETGKLTFSGTGEISDDWKTSIDHHNVITVVINEGVTKIGKDAFWWCTDLTNVTMPNSVTSIDQEAFYNCFSLINITMSNNLTSIGANAFASCSKLTDITIPKTVTSIYKNPFSGCDELKNIQVSYENPNYSSDNGILFNKEKTELICYPNNNSGPIRYTIPSNVTTIGENAFYDCNNVVEITIPDSVTSIGRLAFAYNHWITEITIPSSVTNIGEYVLDNCEKLERIEVAGENANYTSENGILFNKDKTELICYPCAKTETSYIIPNSVTNIADKAFWNCKNLTNITIPNTVTNLGKEAFYSCSGLTNIIIPNSITEIGENTFYDCSKLTNIIIPNSVTNIGSTAFNNCDNVTIYCKSNSTANTYATTYNINFQTDDDTPDINLAQEGSYIKITAIDSGVGLDNEAYSLDGNNWYENNSLAVNESKIYTVHVKDKLGNIGTQDIQVDVTNPEITDIKVDGYKITVTAIDNVKLADAPYSINGTNYQASNEFTVTQEGIYTIYVKDAQGNVATETVTVNKKADDNKDDDNKDDDENKDTTPPTITNIKVDGYKITVTATDNVKLANTPYSINGTNYQASNEFTVTQEGTYTIYVKDAQGNIATETVTINKKADDSKDDNKDSNKDDNKDDDKNNIDTTSPSISDIKVDGYKIIVIATDSQSGLADKAYSLDKENWQASNEIVVTKTGRYMVYIKDKSGNIANQLVIVDGKDNNNLNNSESPINEDNSTSKSILPKSGDMSIIFIIVIAGIVGIISFKKIRKMKF